MSVYNQAAVPGTEPQVNGERFPGFQQCSCDERTCQTGVQPAGTVGRTCPGALCGPGRSNWLPGPQGEPHRCHLWDEAVEGYGLHLLRRARKGKSFEEEYDVRWPAISKRPPRLQCGFLIPRAIGVGAQHDGECSKVVIVAA